ncbi:hypothetical protein [Jiangella aurantiaca]|nr:hypothetical protein [Jiangella aurantiaca]
MTHPSRQRRATRAALTCTAALLLVTGFSAASGQGVPAPDGSPDDHAHDQHGPSSGHLPGSVENVELLSSIKLTAHEGDISDVSALQTADGRWFAYVGDWAAHCETGGVHVVDFTDPEKPHRAGFLNSPGFGYVTEGVQALHVETSEFSGDLLVISNEWCRTSPNPANMPGGITLWDITEPTDPQLLVQAFGDFDIHGNRANESHSAIAWNTAAGNAYVAAIDNEEVDDVDLYDITDPRNPVLIAETRLPGVHVDGYGQEKTSHDFDVLQFPDGTWHLMVSDWDAGWIDVEVTDPAVPVIVGDFDYAECDQVVPTACPPEGNAHQGEWNSDASVFVGTDEDLSPFRTPITVLDGPLAGQRIDAGEFGWTKPVATFPDGKVNGPTIFGGYGCPGDPVPPVSALGPLGPDEEAIVMFQRGPVNDPNDPRNACFFSDKVRSGEEAGYDVVIVANHHTGAQGGETPAAFFCGGQGSPVLGTAAGLCVGHEFMHEAFGRTPDYTLPYPLGDPGDLEPDFGDLGPRVSAQAEFDGWGYARVVDTSNPAAPTEIAQITIPETDDPAFATGFGDLAVHEVEVPRGDPNEGGPNVDDDLLAYFAWYSGGFRVVDISDPANPAELGHYIDEDGNNFWGVALATDQNGDRIVLASDRDYGLFIFRYTGPLPE